MRKTSFKRGKSGGGRTFLNIIWTLIVVGIVVGFLRMNGLYSVQSVFAYFRGVGNNIHETYAPKMKKPEVCNFVKDKNCLYSRPNISPAKPQKPSVRKEIAGTAAGVAGKAGKLAIRGLEKVENKLKNNSSTPAQSAPNTTNADEYVKMLNSVQVKDYDNSKYYRREYKHWILVDGPCNARNESLKLVGFRTMPRTCKPISGYNYVDPYTGEHFTNPKKLDVDHIVPLGLVNRSGGKAWDAVTKMRYANDVGTTLIPVSASANRQKGDKGPSQWLPSNKGYRCEYARKYVKILSKYKLWVDNADKNTLMSELNACPVK